jgi:phytol kinase
MYLLLTVFAVFAILIISELWWRRQMIHGEFSRKFVHITVGSFVAFWPYFLSRKEMLLLSAAFIAVVLLSKRKKIFRSIHTVQRPTYGEVYFAVMVGILAVANVHPHIFTAALLVMSLADGLAAVIGTRFGKSNAYKIFGARKSVAGTLTFFLVTGLILAVYAMQPGNADVAPWVVVLTLAATALENVAKHGLDNLAVPLLIVGSLQVLT